MRRFWPLFIFIIIFVVAYFNSSLLYSSSRTKSVNVQRIISLAPSITEILFALGLEKQIVAVTDYCDYPAKALALPKVGGFINPNLEKIVALEPDLVILQANQSRLVKQLQQLAIPILAIKNTRLQDILDSIKTIGKATARQQQAQAVINKIRHHIAVISEKVSGRPRPSVLIVFGHSLNTETIKTIYIAGQHDFYNDLIELAGGRNAYQNDKMKVPVISMEGIIQLNPDVIIDIFPEADDHHADLMMVMKGWKKQHYLHAVQNNRVYIIEKNYATIPGPRIDLLLAHIASLIHPEIDWPQKTL